LNYAIIELPKTQVLQLDPANISYCELSQCGAIQGLEMTNRERAVADLQATNFGQLLVLDFSNTEMLVGQRELWLRVETKDGRILEMASVEISMDLKTRTIAEFLLVSDFDEIVAGNLYLGY
jgi:hypothetical protein